MCHVLPYNLFWILLRPTFTYPRTHYSQALTPTYWSICASSLLMSETSHFRHPFLVHNGGHYHLVSDIFDSHLCLLICSHIYINILNSATFIFWTCEFLTSQHFLPYIIFDLTTTLLNIHVKAWGHNLITQHTGCDPPSDQPHCNTMCNILVNLPISLD